MKPKVFLDTNIILDMLLERPGYEFSANLFQMHDDGKIEVLQSSLSLANIAFVIRKEFSKGCLQPTIKQLCEVSEVLSVDESTIQTAVMMDGPDFEDILQLVCASEGGCDYVITRNVKDFKITKGLLPDFRMPEICTPEDFLLSGLAAN